MKCVCGNEFPAGAKFCGKCGRPVAEAPKAFCRTCGAALRPGAKFCSNCGAAVSGEPAKAVPDTCRSCGAVLYPGARFCGKCRTPVAADAPAPRAADKAGGSAPIIGKSGLGEKKARAAKEKAAPVRGAVAGPIREKSTENVRLRKILLVLLIVGLCLSFSGLCGKISVGMLSSKLNSDGLFMSMGLLYGSGANDGMGEQILVSLLRNDSSIYMNAMNQAMGSMGGSAAGALSGLGTALLGTTVAQSFPEMRRSLMRLLDFMWYPFTVMSYYQIMLIVGLAAAAVSAVGWKLLKGNGSDIRELKLKPAIVLGIVWLVLNIILVVMTATMFQ